MYRVLRDRFLTKPKKPGFIVANKGGRYALHYHAEQAPNALSRMWPDSMCTETRLSVL